MPKNNYAALEIIETIIVYGVCAYVAIMFFSKGEGIRNALIYGSFALWLVSLRWKRPLWLFKSPLARLYFVFFGVCLASVALSSDVNLSLKAARHLLAKGFIFFMIISTTFDTEDRTRKLSIAFTITAVSLVLTSFYSYVATEAEYLKPNLTIMHAWHNRFARFLCLSVPFSAILMLHSRGKHYRVMLSILILASFLGIILSTSRVGYISALSMIAIWLGVLSAKNIRLRKTFGILVMIFIVLNVFAWVASPSLRKRVTNTVNDIQTLNKRTEIWVPMMAAIKERPVFGWGYGPKIVRDEIPYRGTGYEPPKVSSHNTFLLTVFSSGLIGLASYSALLIYAIYYCRKWMLIQPPGSYSAHTLLAVLSVLVGNYLIHSMFAVVSFRDLSIILGAAVSSSNLRS